MKNKKYLSRMLTTLALGAVLTFGFGAVGFAAQASADPLTQPSNIVEQPLKLTQEWDKTFPKNAKVNHTKVIFHNRYGITLAADLYTPKTMKKGEKLPAIAVAGPYGAVKEQVSGRYAQEMAARGFITMAFDPSYTGESGGVPRNVTSPDINTEDFSAAVDYLANRDDVNPEQIGILGICGWGGFSLNAAAMDPRIKATVSSTMYDMSRVIANGYFDYEKDAATIQKERKELRKALSAQRTADYKNGTNKMAGGVPTEVDDKTPQFVKDYHDYYQTKLGYHPRSFGSTTGATLSSVLDFANMPLRTYSEEIDSAVLLIHGEKAHSRYFSEDAFKKLKGDNKELLIIPGAVHTDLYYKMDVIPFDKIEKFYRTHLK
jgi:hypothetical protein